MRSFFDWWREEQPESDKPWLVLGKGPSFARRAEYEETVTAATRAQLAYEEDVRRSEAAQRQWEADRARWEADVRACQAGDRMRCAPPRS